MKLIGLLINNFNNFTKQSPIAFDSNIKITFSNLTLNIDIEKNRLQNFYAHNISNITAIVGTNGSGKTSILDIIATSHEEQEKFLSSASYCLIFLEEKELYLEMNNFSLNCIKFSDKTIPLNYKNYTGNYSTNTHTSTCRNKSKIYYFQPEKKVIKNSRENSSLIEREYMNNELLSIKDGIHKAKAYNLLVKEGFLSNKDYKWLIQVDTYEQIKDIITDYCWRNIFDDISEFESEFYIKEYISKHKIEERGTFRNNHFTSVKKFLYQKSDIFDKEESNDDVEKKSKQVLNEYKQIMSIDHFNFLLKPFHSNLKETEMSFKELQILSCLVDSYIYIRNLYFPNYNNEESPSPIVKNWESIFEHIVKYFKQLLDPEFIASKENPEYFANFCSEFNKSRLEPKNDISDYIDFTFKILRSLYQIDDNLVESDKYNQILTLDTSNNSITNFFDKLSLNIDFDTRRKIFTINNRNPVNWFKLMEVTSKGEQSLLEITTLINCLKKNSLEDSLEEIIIVVDEIEEGLHLEWSRRLLDFLIGQLKTVKDIRFQLIFTTHSPYMLSDIKPGNVVTLTKDIHTGLTSVSPYKNTFAKNIQEIMHDNMFIEDIYGKFAISKINHLIKKLTDDIDNNDEGDVILDEIKMISEPLLRNKLLEMFENKFQNETIEQEITRLESRLAELKENRRL